MKVAAAVFAMIVCTFIGYQMGRESITGPILSVGDAATKLLHNEADACAASHSTDVEDFCKLLNDANSPEVAEIVADVQQSSRN
ncbi:MAG TPA: hypothetical protein VHY19_03395 [Steroidobacteraceae bacterium]|jgi:hypothetical protein|nr:hypothetical protein [Steroidobacteraceae bacterium]